MRNIRSNEDQRRSRKTRTRRLGVDEESRRKEASRGRAGEAEQPGKRRALS